MYLPYQQAPQQGMYLAVRARGDPMAELPAVRDRIRRLDATLPIQEPKLMREVIQETVSAMRLTTGMMMIFGMLALLLAAVGVYGVMAHSVTQRRREFGIRIALGARPGAVLKMVVRQRREFEQHRGFGRCSGAAAIRVARSLLDPGAGGYTGRSGNGAAARLIFSPCIPWPSESTGARARSIAGRSRQT